MQGFEPANGDVQGTYPDLTVTGIQTVPVDIEALSDGDVLVYDENSQTFINDEVAPKIFSVAQSYTSLPTLTSDEINTLANVEIITEETGCVVVTATGEAVLDESSLSGGNFGSLLYGINIEGFTNEANESALTIYYPDISPDVSPELFSATLSISRIFSVSGNTTFEVYAQQIAGESPISIIHVNLIAQFYPDYYSICSK